MSDVRAVTPIRVPEWFKIYEDGKQRRYSMLFTVNGGAFAVATFLKAHQITMGSLNLETVSLGMIAFTTVMVCDIHQLRQLDAKAD